MSESVAGIFSKLGGSDSGGFTECPGQTVRGHCGPVARPATLPSHVQCQEKVSQRNICNVQSETT